MARRTLLTAQLIQALTQAVTTGAAPPSAAQRLGVPKSTFYDWMRWGKAGRPPFSELSDRISQALSEYDVRRKQNVRAADLFVGREKELSALHSGLQDAISGKGRLILVTGEPGIGKTRLVQELSNQTRYSSRLLFWGRCHEGGGAPVFWPWVQVLRAYAQAQRPTVLRSEMGLGAADICQAFPEIAERCPGVAVPAVLQVEQTRFRLFDSLTTFLKNAARRQPLVLVLDDLHWADKASLLLLQFLAQEMIDARLLVVATYRNTEVGREDSLFSTLGELARQPLTTTILLSGLSQLEVACYIRETAGVVAPTLSPAAVCEKTEGNPFFVGEVVRLLAADGGPTPQSAIDIPIPTTVHAAIARRLERLSVDCSRTLVTAAAIGREFEVSVLQRVVGTQRAASVVAALEEARTTGIVSAGPGKAGHYSFSHALIREAVYEDMAVARRVDLHHQIVEALEHTCGADAESPLGALAHHSFAAAKGGGDIDKAVHYAVRAAEHAACKLAYEEAVAQYQRALDALDLRRGDADVRSSDEPLRCELLLSLGSAQNQAGERDRARATFLRAAALIRALKVPLGTARAGLLLTRAALGLGFLVEAGKTDDYLVCLCEEALDFLETEDSPARARMLAQLAVALSWSSDVQRVGRLSDQAVAMARRIGDNALLAYTLDARHFATPAIDDIDLRLAAATEVVRLAEQIGDVHRKMQGYFARLPDLLDMGDILAVDAEIEEYARLARQLRQPLYVSIAARLRAMRALIEGDLDQAEHLAREALQLGQRAQNPSAAQAFTVQMFALRREQGRLEELEAPLKAQLEQHGGAMWRCILACVYGELDREQPARREFEQLSAHGFSALRRDNTWLLALSLLAEVSAFLGDANRATRLYELLLPYQSRHIVVQMGVACMGSASHFLGLLARTKSRWDDAARHFEEALVMNTRIGARPLVLRTKKAYAAMLASCGLPEARERAAELPRQAQTTARQLDVDPEEPKRSVRELAAKASGGQLGEQVRETHLFRKKGDYWTIAYDGDIVHLKDLKGLHYVAYLLRSPGREVHVIELASLGRLPFQDHATLSVPEGTAFTRHGPLPGIVGTSLDAKARGDYWRRLGDLREELDEADRLNDVGRAARAREEIAILTAQLAGAIRARKSDTAAERARQAVGKNIQAALKAIRESHPALGRHLAATVKRGYFCAYTPDPRHPISWITGLVLSLAATLLGELSSWLEWLVTA